MSSTCFYYFAFLNGFGGSVVDDGGGEGICECSDCGRLEADFCDPRDQFLMFF